LSVFLQTDEVTVSFFQFANFMSCRCPLCHQTHSGMMLHISLDLLSHVVCPIDYSATIPAREVTYFT